MILNATAVLVRNDRVLMTHRHPAREAYPDRWALPGGHVEPGESSRDAVVRECLEELGIHVRDPRPVPLTVHAPHLTTDGFVVTRWDGEPANLAPGEHDDLRWCRPDELAHLQLAHPESLPDIITAIDLISGSTGEPGST
ncbi:NUDIX domain-containing protein [Flexivirga sp. ID2601S]|uniref:NUDIX domain-containing protein n=1 Tax=Flexivirga aerilata TaxID=1656889 RepID=A0A849AFU4_9MICO|nr:NUDIX domain-containing protein [Flexivirga aerilata]